MSASPVASSLPNSLPASTSAAPFHQSTPPRLYTLGETSKMLVLGSLLLLLFSSESFSVWANRMEASDIQTAWLNVIDPWNGLMNDVGLAKPRAQIVALLPADTNADDINAAAFAAINNPNHNPDDPDGQPSNQPTDYAALMRDDLDDADDADDDANNTDDLDPADAALLYSIFGERAAKDPCSVLDQYLEQQNKNQKNSQSNKTDAVISSTPPSTILLTGDSMMAVGLAPALFNLLQADKQAASEFSVVRGFKSGTGLSRPEVHDWDEASARLVRTHKPNLVVVAMGGNDAQGVRHNGKVLTYGTTEWDDLYKTRLKNYMQNLTADGAHLLWLGLPAMRAGTYDDKMNHLNSLAEEITKLVPNASYMPMRPYLLDDKNQFAAFLPDDRGKLVRVRSEDGIHLADPGGARVMPHVVEWMRAHRSDNKSSASSTQTASQTTSSNQNKSKKSKKSKKAKTIDAVTLQKLESICYNDDGSRKN